MTSESASAWRAPAIGSALPELVDLAASDAHGAAALRRLLAGDLDLPTRAERLQQRDQALRDAAAVLSRAPNWNCCLALAEAVARFESRVWPRLAAGGAADDLGPLDAALMRARLWGRLPATARMLWRVLHPRRRRHHVLTPGP